MFSYTVLAFMEEQISFNKVEAFQHVSVIMNYLILFKGKQSEGSMTKHILVIIIRVLICI
jgi:hypothetical protein